MKGAAGGNGWVAIEFSLLSLERSLEEKSHLPVLSAKDAS
jgi:hypothetical protein